MSWLGYKPKTKPAIWREAFPSQKVKSAHDSAKAVGFTRGRRARIRPVSKRRLATSREYQREAAMFVRAAIATGETCPVFALMNELPERVQKFLTQPWDGRLRSSRLNEVHHVRGRNGPLLMDKRWWRVVSKWGHRAVHAFPKVFQELGLLAGAGEWNNPS